MPTEKTAEVERGEAAQQVFERAWREAQAQGIGSFAELARQCDLSRSTVYLLSEGKRAWTRKSLLKFAAGLGVSADWLRDGEGPKTPEGQSERPRGAGTSVEIEQDGASSFLLRVRVPRSNLDAVMAQLAEILKDG